METCSHTESMEIWRLNLVGHENKALLLKVGRAFVNVPRAANCQVDIS